MAFPPSSPSFSSSSSSSSITALLLVASILSFSLVHSCAQLSSNFYSTTCPSLTSDVTNVLTPALKSDPRIGASLLRLFFHDCFVLGCDASILLDSNTTNSIVSEKTAGPNLNSTRGFEVIDTIKSVLEKSCPNTVSCADILALAAQVSVSLSSGPSYIVPLGRRDGRTANANLANTAIPAPSDNITTIISKFSVQGLNITDLVALSGAHTIGFSQCKQFSYRLYNFNGTGMPDPSLNATYLTTLQTQCPQNGPGSNLVRLDKTTVTTFDNAYFNDLLTNEGLLQSDQELLTNFATLGLVKLYATSQLIFFTNFAMSMIKMGNIGVLTGNNGEIRTNCRLTN